MGFISKLYNNKILASLVHTLPYELCKVLSDCDSVLDLGCGPSSPLQHCKNIKSSVGVEVFKPYLNESRKRKIHSKYLNKQIQELNFKKNSFDAVILIEVLEHLSKKDGLKILKKAEEWAKKKVIVTTPNGFINQREVDKNPYQTHLSGWDYKEMTNFGYKVRGLAGLKFLRKEVENDKMGDDLTTSIRFWPKPFWFIIAALSQIITYYFPMFSFELFNVKKVDYEK